MIQGTGTLTMGVVSYINPLINIWMLSASKYTPTQGVAQIGFVQETTSPTQSFNAVTSCGTYNYNGLNPSFNDIQNAVLFGLKADYPDMIFTIVI
jgi:hypothetical protein